MKLSKPFGDIPQINLPSSKLPQTSLIICSRNRHQLLRETVESVLAGEEVPTELVLVDQSDMPNAELSSFHTQRPCVIRYLHVSTVGLSRARNTGFAAANYDIVACIDDDMVVDRVWFGTLIQALIIAGPRTVVTGRVLPAPAEVAGGFVPALVLGEDPAVYRGRISKDVLAGCHLAMYGAALVDVGGFDERLGAGSTFPAADDNDLGFRLLEAGYSIVYTPAAVIYHRAWRSGRDFFVMRWNYGHGKGGYYTKHFSLRDRYMLRRIAWDIGHRAVRFPLQVLRQRRTAAGDVVYSAGVLWGTLQWFITQSARDGLGSLAMPTGAHRLTGTENNNTGSRLEGRF